MYYLLGFHLLEKNRDQFVPTASGVSRAFGIDNLPPEILQQVSNTHSFSWTLGQVCLVELVVFFLDCAVQLVVLNTDQPLLNY